MTANIQTELRTIQTELKAPKNQRNTFGGFDYRNAEDILEAAKPLCATHNLTLTINDEIVYVGDRYYVKATASVTNDEGISISSSGYAREAEEKKGMDSAQVTGSTSSYARKYALGGLFAIDDSKDPDTDEHAKIENARTSTTSNPAPTASPNRPATDKQKAMIAALAHKLNRSNTWIDNVMQQVRTSAEASSVIEQLQAAEERRDA